MSVIEGSLGILPRRIMVDDDERRRRPARPDRRRPRPRTAPGMSGRGDITEDAFLGGRLRLRQPRKGHRAGHDAILLAAATDASAGERVVEFGAGVGAAGLALATRIGGLDLTLVEIDEGLAALARENAALNGIACRRRRARRGGEGGGLCRARVLRRTGRPRADESAVQRCRPASAVARSRRAARRMRRVHRRSMRWVHAARRLLKPGGTLTLIWRADGAGEVLAALGRGFGGIVDSAGASEIGCGGHSRAGEGGERIGGAADAAAGLRAQRRRRASRRRQAEAVLRGEETLRLGAD